MKQPHLVKHLRPLLVTALVLAGSTPVLGAESPPSSTSSASFALQWALLQGVRADGEGGEGEAEATASADLGGEQALDWDFHWDVRRDADELVELFRLSSLETLQQGRSLLSGDKGTVTVGEGEGDERLDVDISLSIEPFEIEEEVFDAARATVSIRRGGEVISKPMIVTKLGERAIVTTAEPEKRVVVYIVIQVDPVEGPE